MKKSEINKTAIFMTSILAVVIIVLGISGTTIYINQQKISADGRALEMKIKADSENATRQNEIEQAKIKQKELESCLSSIDQSQVSSLQAIARSSCQYKYDN